MEFVRIKGADLFPCHLPGEKLDVSHLMGIVGNESFPIYKAEVISRTLLTL